MDAERGVMGHGCPFATTPGAAPERGEFCAAKPGCRGGLLFGYFFLATQEKVTRPAGRNQPISTHRNQPRHRPATNSKKHLQVISAQLPPKTTPITAICRPSTNPCHSTVGWASAHRGAVTTGGLKPTLRRLDVWPKGVATRGAGARKNAVRSGAGVCWRGGHIGSKLLRKAADRPVFAADSPALSQNRHIPHLPSAAVPGWTR